MGIESTRIKTKAEAGDEALAGCVWGGFSSGKGFRSQRQRRDSEQMKQRETEMENR